MYAHPQSILRQEQVIKQRKEAKFIVNPTYFFVGETTGEIHSPTSSGVSGTWLLSPSADPRAKMYSVESRKDIGQILDSLKNCFGDMQLEV